jgi:purine-cytosine permease-like protein
MRSVNFLGKRVPVPGNLVLRVILGLVLIAGGLLGFMPVLGFWMLPLGLLVLSIDFPPVRRFRRNATVRMGDWFKTRWPSAAARLGLTARRRNRA